MRTFFTPTPRHILPLARGVPQLDHIHNNTNKI